MTPLRDAARWVCWTPRRAWYVALNVALLVSILAIYNVAQSVGSVTAARAPRPVASASPTTGPVQDDAGALAVRFVNLWLARTSQNPDTWKVQLAGMATPELAEGLLTGAGVPGPAGRATGAATVVGSSGLGTIYRVPTTLGPHVVSVEPAESGYLVADFITAR